MLTLLLAAALAAQQPQQVPSLTAPAPSAGQLPEQLDELLARKDYKNLGHRIAGINTAEDALPALDWLQAKMIEGNSAFIPMLYSRLLWGYSSTVPKESAREIRKTAAMATLYGFAAISVDGTRCGDGTAPSHRLEQLMTMEPAIPAFFQTLSGEEANQLLEIALLTEARTADRRAVMGDVDFLCRGGMEEMTYNMEHGTSREVPSRRGAGRTVELSGDGKYRPSEKPASQWRAAAEKARARLRTELGDMVRQLAAKD